MYLHVVENMARYLIVMNILIYSGFCYRGINNKTSEKLPGIQVCGIDDADKIIGGSVSALGQYPWLVLLRHRDSTNNNFTCGGTLINKRYILTAAQCVVDDLQRLIPSSVRLGEHQLSTNPDCHPINPNPLDCADKTVDIEIDGVIIHREYNPETFANDIALLRLASEVKYTDYIKPICLPVDDKFISRRYYGDLSEVAGWGANKTYTQSDVKLRVEISVLTNSRCENLYIPLNVTINKNLICAGGEEGKNICRGDLGGPLMFLDADSIKYNVYAIGIASHIPYPCGAGGQPGIYTRVTEYIPWILDNIKP